MLLFDKFLTMEHSQKYEMLGLQTQKSAYLVIFLKNFEVITPEY